MNDNNKQLKVVVVLGSHRLTPLASIPLLTFLKNNNISISSIVASGGGAILAGLFGMGKSLSEIPQILQELSKVSLFRAIDLPSILSITRKKRWPFKIPASIYKVDRLKKALRDIFGEYELEKCHPKTFLQATNVYSAEGVDLSAGRLADCVYASSMQFPLHPPIYLQDQWLVNGTFSHPLPILPTISKMDVDVIIAVNVLQQCCVKGRPYTSFLNAFFDACFTHIEEPQHLFAVDMHHHAIVFIPITLDSHLEFRNLSSYAVKEILAASQEKVQERAYDILESMQRHP